MKQEHVDTATGLTLSGPSAKVLIAYSDDEVIPFDNREEAKFYWKQKGQNQKYWIE